MKMTTAGIPKSRIARNTTEIKVWMYRKEVRVVDVAKALGMPAPNVSSWLNNKKESRKLAQWFLNQGCPAEFLGLVDAHDKESAA